MLKEWLDIFSAFVQQLGHIISTLIYVLMKQKD